MWRELPQNKIEVRRTLRTERRTRRSAVDNAAWRKAGRHLASVLMLALDSRLEAVRCIAAYEALPTEPPTRALLEALQNSDRQVLVPILLANKDLSWRDLATDTDLGCDAITLTEAIVLPALAIDRNGLRLGQGGGIYDRVLPRRTPHSWTVAVVFDQELAWQVPSEPHDQRVDAVLTPGHGIVQLPAVNPAT